MTVVWEMGLPDDGFFERRHDAGGIPEGMLQILMPCGQGGCLFVRVGDEVVLKSVCVGVGF